MQFVDNLKSMLGNKNLNIRWRFEILAEYPGARSRVYQVRDKKSKETYVLKVLSPVRIAEYRKRFGGLKVPSEFEILQSLDHPAIIKAFEEGHTMDEDPYILLEHVEGESLQSVLEYPSKLIGHKLSLLRQAADTLAYIHDQGLLYRDIHPSNMIVDSTFQTLKFCDFAMTVPNSPEFIEPGNRLVDTAYMPPETLRRGTPGNERFDIFSFGVFAYKLVTAELPWAQDAATSVERALRVARDVREIRPRLHPHLAEAIMRCLSNNPRERPPSMRYFLQMLEEVDREELSQQEIDAYYGTHAEETPQDSPQPGVAESTEFQQMAQTPNPQQQQRRPSPAALRQQIAPQPPNPAAPEQPAANPQADYAENAEPPSDAAANGADSEQQGMGRKKGEKTQTGDDVIHRMLFPGGKPPGAQ